MSDERKEACIHCGNVWYSIHYKDGVCNECQNKKLPGRSVVENKTNYRSIIITFVLLTVLFYLILK
jgi:hypothetical protein